MNRRGFFISLEGAEGVGKSTNLEFIRNFLEGNGQKVVVTREPGGTPLAEEIRQLLLTTRDETVNIHTETLLMFAARAQHARTVIEPLVRSGNIVLCDRFTHSTYAYQGYGHGISTALIDNIYRFVADEVFPDLTFVLDLSPEEGIERTKKRSLSNNEVLTEDRYEKMELAFHKRIRNGFKEIVLANRERCVLIDASLGEEEIYNNIVSIVSARCLEITT